MPAGLNGEDGLFFFLLHPLTFCVWVGHQGWIHLQQLRRDLLSRDHGVGAIINLHLLLETQGAAPSAGSAMGCESLWNKSCSSCAGNSTSPGNDRVGKEFPVLGSTSCSLCSVPEIQPVLPSSYPYPSSSVGFFIVLPKGCCSQAQKTIPGQ